jgi:hypothetical protein
MSDDPRRVGLWSWQMLQGGTVRFSHSASHSGTITRFENRVSRPTGPSDFRVANCDLLFVWQAFRVLPYADRNLARSLIQGWASVYSMLPLAALTVAAAVVICVGLHLATLVVLSRTLDRWFKRAHWRAIGCLVLIAIVAHLVEMAVFAGAIRLLEYIHDGVWHTGDMVFEAWYMSAVAYTTLGDVTPQLASVRLLVAVEALTGLILITWTASFLFLVMQRTWDADRVR